MKNKKLPLIVESIIIILLGVLIAIFGGQAVLDIYFGIIFVVGGACLLTVGIIKMATSKEVDFLLTFLSFALLCVGIALFTDFLTFAMLFSLIALLLIALGAALVVYGIYNVLKKNPLAGIVQILVGIAIIVLSILWIFVPEFQTAFWIVMGILIAVYGAFSLVTALLKN